MLSKSNPHIKGKFSRAWGGGHVCNYSFQETEAVWLHLVPVQPGLHSYYMSQRQTKNILLNRNPLRQISSIIKSQNPIE